MFWTIIGWILFIQIFVGGSFFIYHGAFTPKPIIQDIIPKMKILYIEFQFDQSNVLTYYEHLLAILKECSSTITEQTNTFLIMIGDDFNPLLVSGKVDKKGIVMTKDRCRNILAVVLESQSDIEEAERIFKIAQVYRFKIGTIEEVTCFL